MNNLSDLYKTNPVKACRLALRRTRHLAWQKRLDAIDKLIGTFGTEAIRGEWQNGFWCDVVAAYCNTGDSYAVTVLHVRGDSWRQPQGRFIVSTLRDFVERNQTRYNIQ